MRSMNTLINYRTDLYLIYDRISQLPHIYNGVNIDIDFKQFYNQHIAI